MTDFTDTVKCMDEQFTDGAISRRSFAVADSIQPAKGMDNTDIQGGDILEKIIHSSKQKPRKLSIRPERQSIIQNITQAFLEAYLRQPSLNDTERIRPNFRLESAKHNRPGSKAADFNFYSRTVASTMPQFSTKSIKTSW